MRRVSLHLIVALITFGIGVVVAGVWMFTNLQRWQDTPSIEPLIAPVQVRISSVEFRPFTDEGDLYAFGFTVENQSDKQVRECVLGYSGSDGSGQTAVGSLSPGASVKAFIVSEDLYFRMWVDCVEFADGTIWKLNHTQTEGCSKR